MRQEVGESRHGEQRFVSPEAGKGGARGVRCSSRGAGSVGWLQINCDLPCVAI
jgi:hypothetical protein